jgi:hypothetical protein
MKIPFIDKALSVIYFLNGEGMGRGDVKYLGMHSADIATLRRVNVR